MSRILVRLGRGGRRRVWLACATAAVAGLPAVRAAAADSTYVGGAGVGNWSPAGVPTAGTNVNFVNADGLNRVLNYDYAGAPITLGGLTIDQTGQGTNTLSMGDFVLTDGGTTVGYQGRGAFQQSAGTHRTGSVFLGWNAGSYGTYTLGNGLLAAGDSNANFVGFQGTGAFVQNGGTHRTYQLFVGFYGPATGSYALNGGSLEVGTAGEFIGANDGTSGAFTQTGGTHTVSGSFYVAQTAGSSGRYSQSGGSLTVSQWEFMGGFSGNGTGVFEQTGGTHTAYGLYVGYAEGASGTYTLSGSGSLTTTFYEQVGASGNGTFDQSGGTHTARTLWVGGGGRYWLSAGSLDAGNLSVGGGDTAAALFRQTGGATTVGTSLAITSGTNQAGTLELTGGTLVSPRAEVGGLDGASRGTGRLSVGGGAMTVSGVLRVWNGRSEIDLSGGALNAGTLQNDGVVYASGGTFTGALVNGGTVRASTGAVLTVTGGISGSNAASTAAGRLVVETGAKVVASYVRQGTLELNGSTTNPPAPAVLSIRRKADGGGTSVVGALAIQTDSAGAPLGRVDLADNALVVDYAGGAASPIGMVRGLIAAGSAGGWMGNGLSSSVAAASNGAGALGYGEAAAVVSPTGGVFEGQNVDGTAVVVRYTVAGDASLDGVVNFDDLLLLAKHYNGTDAYWRDGDFDYDGVVNFDDLLVLAKHYNQGVPTGAVAGAPAGFGADVAAAFAQAAVPEPGAAAGWGVAAGVGLARRRGRRRV